MLTFSGNTEDNKEVYDGVFSLFDTHGLPLDIVFDMLKEENKQPSFISFVEDARTAKWKDKTIYNRLFGAITDVYGEAYWLEVKLRLEKHCDLKEP